jgi:hypothetical protein
MQLQMQHLSRGCQLCKNDLRVKTGWVILQWPASRLQTKALFHFQCQVAIILSAHIRFVCPTTNRLLAGAGNKLHFPAFDK